MQIQFLGAARTVTGTMHKITLEDKHILLDCGMYQGHRKEAEERNRNFPFSPNDIHSIVLSHAHIDHSGNIPLIVKNGFLGAVFCTGATLDLCSAMLRDSAHIQEKDVEFINKKHARKNEPLVEPLYTLADAELSLYHFQGIGYKRPFHILRDIRCTFYDAGHILGSALTYLEIKDKDGQKRVLFTGDLGRKDLPILKDPDIVKNVDYLIIESTYGNRTHESIDEAKSKLCDAIARTIKRGGKIIIPSFSVGRTQELVYYLHQLWEQHQLPEIPIFVDSPLSVNVTEIFRHHSECYDSETRDFLLNDEDPFGFESLTYIRTVERSKELNGVKAPCVIISASGMCEAGRILHHLKNNIEDPKNLILIIGFMAENTLGRKIVEKQKEVKIFGETYSLNAEVEVINAFSAHADSNDLMNFIKQVNSGEERKLKKVFVVHGEEQQSIEFAGRITKELGIDAIAPEPESIFDL